MPYIPNLYCSPATWAVCPLNKDRHKKLIIFFHKWKFRWNSHNNTANNICIFVVKTISRRQSRFLFICITFIFVICYVFFSVARISACLCYPKRKRELMHMWQFANRIHDHVGCFSFLVSSMIWLEREREKSMLSIQICQCFFFLLLYQNNTER